VKFRLRSYVKGTWTYWQILDENGKVVMWDDPFEPTRATSNKADAEKVCADLNAGTIKPYYKIARHINEAQDMRLPAGWTLCLAKDATHLFDEKDRSLHNAGSAMLLKLAAMFCPEEDPEEAVARHARMTNCIFVREVQP